MEDFETEVSMDNVTDIDIDETDSSEGSSVLGKLLVVGGAAALVAAGGFVGKNADKIKAKIRDRKVKKMKKSIERHAAKAAELQVKVNKAENLQ